MSWEGRLVSVLGMGGLPRAAVVIWICAVASGGAYAQEPPPASDPVAPPASAPAPAQPGVLTHKGQFELSLRLPIGVRAIVPYDDGEYCGKADSQTRSGNAAVCTGRAPFGIDLEVGYGMTARIDLLLELRLGLERDFARVRTASDGPRVFHLSPGARFFFSDAGRTKLFTTAQVVFDFTGYETAAGSSRGTDVGVRNLNGLWVDLHPMYGVYGFVGGTGTMSRWLRAELEFGIGVQGRYR